MYFLATLHPALEETKKEGYNGKWLTLKEKKAVIDDFYAAQRALPLRMEHGELAYGNTVPPEERVGKVMDLFLDKVGNIVAKCHLTEKEAVQQVGSDGVKKKAKWGVSVWLDLYYPRGEQGPCEKKLTHVAMTTDPWFAEHHTYIHHWAVSEKGIDAQLAQDYYREGDGECYVKGPLTEKLKGILTDNLFYFAAPPPSPENRSTHVIERSAMSMQVEEKPVAVPAQEVAKVKEEEVERTQQRDRDAVRTADAASEKEHMEERDFTRYKKLEAGQTQKYHIGEVNFEDIGQIKEELSNMLRWLKDTKTTLLDQSPQFRRVYSNLEEQLETRTSDLTNHVLEIYKSGGFPQVDAIRLASIMNTNTEDNSMDASRPLFSFAAASKKAVDSQGKALEDARRRGTELETELIKVKKEKEDLMAQRPTSSPSGGFNFATTMASLPSGKAVAAEDGLLGLLKEKPKTAKERAFEYMLSQVDRRNV